MTTQQSFTLAQQHHQAGRLGEAEALYRQILAVQPNHAEALHYLGVLADQIGRHDVAVELIRQTLVLNPNNPAAHSNLGEAYRAMGRFDEAIASFHRALQLTPDLPMTCHNLGNTHRQQGQFDEAVVAYRRAVELKPDYLEAHFSLGNALKERGQFDEAVAAYRRALQLQPDYAEAHNNLGSALKGRGELDEAIAAYRRAIQYKPEHPLPQSNLVYALHFHPGQDAGTIASEQHRWNRHFSDPLQPFVHPHANDRSPDRRLRVGYVSPDFRDHVVGRNLVPLFRHHDQRDFEILCYSGVVTPDSLTEEFRRQAHQWRSTVGVEDEALAEMIRQDGVDILVDLTLHMAGNRLPVFARRPAPVQVSFAGYPASTGLEAIRYRISDQYLESEIGSELRSSNSDLPTATKEQVCLIDSFWCYDPCGVKIAVNGLPAQENGRVTFGTLNNFCKVNEPLLRLWARVLEKVEDSRMLLLSPAGRHRERTLDILGREGVEAQRVEFVEPCGRQAYLELYHRVDIVLDSFPYNGHTTSLDALWMGVPVVSLAGEQSVSRAGLSQMSNLGLAELVAFSEEDYIGIARQLAHDRPRLLELRRTLRTRMEVSPLMDAPRFARNIETAYRTMWRHWCAEQQSSLP